MERVGRAEVEEGRKEMKGVSQGRESGRNGERKEKAKTKNSKRKIKRERPTLRKLIMLLDKKVPMRV